MAYPKSRSATAELHQGCVEGTHSAPGKDWGGVLGGVEFADCGCLPGCACGCASGDCNCDHNQLATIR